MSNFVTGDAGFTALLAGYFYQWQIWAWIVSTDALILPGRDHVLQYPYKCL